MFGTIRRHQSWLLWVIVVITIVSFVWYFNPAERAQRGGGAGNGFGQIDGHAITQREFAEAYNETRLRYFFNTRKFPEMDETAQQRGFDIERETTYRLILLAKAREAGIEVSDATLGEFAKRVLGDAAGMANFEKQVLQPGKLTMTDFERFLRHDLAIQQLNALHGAAGRLITPAEAEESYRRDHQEVLAQMAVFNVTNFTANVVVTNGALETYYTNAMAQYRTHEKAVVSYVEFPRTNFYAEADKRIEQITNLTARIQEEYFRVGTNNFKDTNGAVLSQEKALAKIRDDFRNGTAMQLARKQANDFANIVYDVLNAAKQPSAALLDTIAKTNNLIVRTTPAFDEESVTNLHFGQQFAMAAFTLNPTNQPISMQPVEGEEAYYIIALKDLIPSKPQTFAEVKTKVEQDYRRMQAFSEMMRHGQAFQSLVTNGIAAGKTFEDIAKSSKVQTITLPPVSRANDSLTNLEEVVSPQQLKRFVLSMDPGKVSPFMPNPPEGGLIVYVKQRIPVNESKMKEDMAKYVAEMRYMKQNEAFNNWFRKVLEKNQATLPFLNKPQQGQPRAARS